MSKFNFIAFWSGCRILWVVGFGGWLLVGCQSRPEQPTLASVAFSPTLTAPIPAGTASPIPPTHTPRPTPAPWRVGAGAGIPAGIIAIARQLSEANPDRFIWSDDPQLTLRLNQGQTLADWVYVVAAPFATLADQITLAEIQAMGQGEGTQPLFLSPETADLLGQLWAENRLGQMAPAAELPTTLWNNRPALTILPFDELTPDLKVLTLDGINPLASGSLPAGYPLTVRVGLVGDPAGVAEWLADWPGRITNRQPAKLSRIALTGVTALTRATAYQMEQTSILYPGEVVAPLLQAADIAHISNEVAFTPDCPYPNPLGGTTFCANDRYFALLETLGADVIELTGNHVNDWGPEALLHTLDLYDPAGMQHYGGGRNLEDALRPALFNHNGNQIAFVGCNPVGPYYAWAQSDYPGSLLCDYPALYAQIGQLREQGYLVIVTLQYLEFYQYAPTPQQQADFRAFAEAGATAVSGSQGHHAQGFDFYAGAFIHYGLGNLFFDQMDALGTRQTFIDSYVIYDGRLLSVELWTGLIENYARPRLMTPDERANLLLSVFQASGW